MKWSELVNGHIWIAVLPAGQPSHTHTHIHE